MRKNKARITILLDEAVELFLSHSIQFAARTKEYFMHFYLAISREKNMTLSGSRNLHLKRSKLES